MIINAASLLTFLPVQRVGAGSAPFNAAAAWTSSPGHRPSPFGARAAAPILRATSEPRPTVSQGAGLSGRASPVMPTDAGRANVATLHLFSVGVMRQRFSDRTTRAAVAHEAAHLFRGA
jgi:hypothetical protein